MAKLRVERRLPLKPYTPKPGSVMDTHATVTLKRDTERKRIELNYGTISMKGNMVGFSFGSPCKFTVVADAPTHAPKAFAALEAKYMGEVDAQQGETWDTLVNLLAGHGMELLPTIPATV